MDALKFSDNHANRFVPFCCDGFQILILLVQVYCKSVNIFPSSVNSGPCLLFVELAKRAKRSKRLVLFAFKVLLEEFSRRLK